MPDTNETNTLLTVESLIHSSTSRLDTLAKELKEHRSMLNSILENDDGYQKASEDAKKLAKAKSSAKANALKIPEAVRLLENIKDKQRDLRELRQALSDYLSQYVTLSGQNQIEGPDGVLRRIVYFAKLVESK